MKSKKSHSSIAKYVVLALLVFAVSVLISVLTRMVLVSNAFPWSFSDEQASLIAGLIEGIIASVAASLVFYQLKIGNDAEKQQSNIDEARFVLQYNQAFIQDSNMCEVERLLEDSMLGKASLPIIRDENRQKFINYLVYLESLAPLVLTNVLTLSHVDDLFAYRFFLAVNNAEVQKDQLFEFPDYYRGCFKLYDEWTKYRTVNGLPILQQESALDKWPHYKAYCNKDIIVRPINASDDKKTVAELIYRTDPYIYPALVGSVAKARKKLPSMMTQNCVFDSANIRVAEFEGKIVGAAVVLDHKPSQGIDVSLVHSESGKDVVEKYFSNIEKYFVDGEETYILCLCVDPRIRGKKVGEMILKNIIQTCKNKRIKLHVLADNQAAIKLYEKHGFISLSEKAAKGYAYITEAPDCYEMTRFEK